MIEIINIHHIGLRKAASLINADVRNIYIGRTNRTAHLFTCGLHNPFHIGVLSREEAIEKYEIYIHDKMRKDQVLREAIKGYATAAKFTDLKLFCYCKPLACHGDVIKEILENCATQPRIWIWRPGPPEGDKQ